MRLPSRRRIKKELSRRLIYYPLLRMLLFKAFFRVAFLVGVVFFVFIGLYLPKIWRTSPADFLPVIRVRGLDLTQAWALKRSAKKAAASGDLAAANFAWQSAVANNPADPELSRGFLENLALMERPDRRSIQAGVGQAVWLLRLAKTNVADLDLAARVLEKHRFYDYLTYILEPSADKLSPSAEAAFMRALFHQGRISTFEQRSRRVDWGKPPDNTLPLYRTAYLAGWGQGIESTDALHALEAARKDPEKRLLASRLFMSVCARRGNAIGYGEALAELERSNNSTVADHVGYWRTLITATRRKEAQELAQAFTRSPESGSETLRLAEVYHLLGLTEQSREVLKQFAPQFAHSPELWASYASILEDAKDWAEMRALAFQIRNLPAARDALQGYSYFLEGRAELGYERPFPAKMAFEKAAVANYDYPGLGLIVARDLTRSDFPALAKKILFPLETVYKDNLEYWNTAFETAHRLKDPEWTLVTAQHGYQLKPQDPAMLNRYAAALIVNRARPEESIKHTVQLIAFYPDSLAAVVNHSMALILNNRVGEAKVYLDRVKPETLLPAELSAFLLAKFEAHLRSGEKDRALAVAQQIEPRHLFPNQVEWLQKNVENLSGHETKLGASL